MTNNNRKSLELLKECLIDYSTPIYVIGNLKDLNINNLCVVSVKEPKSKFVIINDKYPKWLKNVYENDNQIVVFKDFDKLNYKDQKLFMDIICYNRISSEELPENLKIIMNSENECKLIPEIEEVVQKIRL